VQDKTDENGHDSEKKFGVNGVNEGQFLTDTS
jgi:hypothetical protein